MGNVGRAKFQLGVDNTRCHMNRDVRLYMYVYVYDCIPDVLIVSYSIGSTNSPHEVYYDEMTMVSTLLSHGFKTIVVLQLPLNAICKLHGSLWINHGSAIGRNIGLVTITYHS